MMLARVIGTVVSTQKDPSLEGLRFMLCKPINPDGEACGAPVVAVDTVGAGVDEVVLYATGSSARQTVQTNNRPCDAVIMAIVDTWEVGGDTKYQKGKDG